MERLTGEDIARSALGHDRYEELVALARAIDAKVAKDFLITKAIARTETRDGTADILPPDARLRGDAAFVEGDQSDAAVDELGRTQRGGAER